MNNLVKADSFSPMFEITDPQGIIVKPGSILAGHALSEEIRLPESLTPGRDYLVIVDDALQQMAIENPSKHGAPMAIGGFHVGLDGNIVPASVWDSLFRPKAKDPRGMVLSGDCWIDIYLLNGYPTHHGTSAAGVTIADGSNYVLVPNTDDTKPLDWWTANLVLAAFGKQLLSMAEFCVAMQGVEEGKRAGKDPEQTGHIEGLKSAIGIEQATGCMWTWGRDFEPSDSCAVVMGSNWNSSVSGPRRFSNYYGPDDNYNYVGARGRCDHLILG